MLQNFAGDRSGGFAFPNACLLGNTGSAAALSSASRARGSSNATDRGRLIRTLVELSTFHRLAGSPLTMPPENFGLD